VSWDYDPLWAKTRLFFQHAFGQERDDPAFGLWCSFGLELLARAAVAFVSPTLLAQPDNEQKNLLHVVHKESELPFPRSIPANRVVSLCVQLFPAFSDEDSKACQALLNRRNAELHSAAAAFEEYRPSQWLTGFYHACESLTTVIGESLEALFGDEEAEFAQDLLAEKRDTIKKSVLDAVSAHKKSFEELPSRERLAARAEAEARGRELSTERHHRVVCPACSCTATVQGRLFGKAHVNYEDSGEIVVRQAVSPTEFSCPACGLKLGTYAELEVAGVADHYTRRTTSSPEDYYGLVDPAELEYDQEGIGPEYDNE
jgi:hypothetical protein